MTLHDAKVAYSPDDALVQSPSLNLGDSETQLDCAGPAPFRLANLRTDEPGAVDSAAPNVGSFLKDMELDLRIQLGATRMPLSEVFKLRSGSLVKLSQELSEAVGIYANEQLVARGEVLVLNDHFCVRVTEIVCVEPRNAA